MRYSSFFIGLAILLSLVSVQSFANPAWHTGVVNRVAISGDGFIVTFEGQALNDCMHKYAYFHPTKLSEFQIKTAFTMATVSLTTGTTMGIVIDKMSSGPGERCYAMGMTADLRS